MSSHASVLGTAPLSGAKPGHPRTGAVTSNELLQLASEYSALRIQLNSFLETQHRLWPGEAWTQELEMRWSRWMEPIRDRMAEIRWEVVKIQATDVAGAKAKAAILHDVVDKTAEDVGSRLTLSLCKDLIALPDMSVCGDAGYQPTENSPNFD